MKKFVLRNEVPSSSVNYQIDYKNLLNAQQYEAVMSDTGFSLVVAGAGTGKTRTLVYRVARLVESGVRPESILLLTFTRRAAFEMLRKASQILDDRCRKVRGGTFHQQCAFILRQYAEQTGYSPTFTVLDASDAGDVIQVVRTEHLQKMKKGIRFPNKKTLQQMFSSVANRQLTLHEILSSDYPQFLSLFSDIKRIQDRFFSYKKAQNLMDFDDLLLNTVDLLQHEEEIHRDVASRNRFIMVDEYQDTNSIQAALTQLLSSEHRNLMVVGDDAQSIYRFRGANSANMRLFKEENSEVKVTKLEQNYRSTDAILQLANSILQSSKSGLEKKLWGNQGQGELPGLIKTSDEEQQSQFISQMILHLREQQVELKNISVLFRNGRDSFDLEMELNRKSIPYIKYGGQKVTEAAHIKDILAHLRILINPKDIIAWQRVLGLIDGVGPKTIQSFSDWIQQQPDNQVSFSSIDTMYLKKIASFLDMVQSLGHMQSLEEQVSHLIEYYRPICNKKFDDYPKREKDLESFKTITLKYNSIKQLLEELTLDPIEGSAIETQEAKEDEAPLVLSTIHSAKGLEWEHVFIMQCLDGIIPSGYSVDDPDAMEEERRLLYVAITRAKSALYFTYPLVQMSNYGDYFTNPSRFIQNIPSTLLEPWQLTVETEPKQPLVSGMENSSLLDSPDAAKN